MLKNLIFDFDGTIVDSKYLMVDVYNRMAEKKNYRKVDLKEFNDLSKLSYKEKAKFMGIPFYKIPTLLIEFLNEYKKRASSINLIEGMFEVLQSLKNSGMKLSIISSNSADTIKEFLDMNNLNVFDDIISSKGLFAKDSSINSYIRKSGLNKDETYYVGDEVRDIDACKKSNIKIICVAWGYDTTEVLKSQTPDFIVNTPNEILEII